VVPRFLETEERSLEETGSRPERKLLMEMGDVEERVEEVKERDGGRA